MKKKQKEELREKPLSELEKILAEKQKEQVSLKIEKKASRQKDVHLLGKARQEIAVIRTIIRERELEEKVA